MKCHISNIKIENYKSIKNVSVAPNNTLSVFVGKNGSGKTVFLSAIMQLKKLMRYHTQSRKEIDLSSNKPITLEVEFTVGKKKITYGAKFLELEKDRYERDDLFVIEEFFLIQNERPIFNIPLYFILDYVGNHSKHRSDIAHYEMFMSSAKSFKENDFSRDFNALLKHGEALRTIKSYVEGIHYYSATKFSNPANCPSSIEFDESGDLITSYLDTALVHKTFLSDLYQLNWKNFELYSLFLKTVTNPALELIDRIEFKELVLPSYSYNVSQGGKVQRKESKRKVVVPIFKKGRFELSPSSLSEGTFKTLGLIFYIMSDQGSVSLLEEPEVCVHHALLSRIVDIIKSYSYEKQIFLTTHSEVVLDSVEPEAIFVIAWKAGSKIFPLESFLGRRGSESLKKYLKEEGNLGEYLKYKDIFDE